MSALARPKGATISSRTLFIPLKRSPASCRRCGNAARRRLAFDAAAVGFSEMSRAENFSQQCLGRLRQVALLDRIDGLVHGILNTFQLDALVFDDCVGG